MRVLNVRGGQGVLKKLPGETVLRVCDTQKSKQEIQQ